ncbi:hypothetical protein [Planobispora rosea]|uniref:hypothetical protein n=1 Tax=Planobispora rosea TaxID=35762 RepID=UPI00083AF196|nr:hypothetical protein [Planobispora rosea]
MRRVLGPVTGLVAGLALVSAAPAPAAAAQAVPVSAAACRTDTAECGRDPLISIAVKVRATPAVRPGGRVTYVIDYSQTWTPSFAPYRGAFWVGGRFPEGARGPSRAVLYDTAGKRLAVLPCRRYADGTWCDAHGPMPHRGRVVMSARLPAPAKGTATAGRAKLGFDSFEALDEAEYARHRGRRELRERFCEFRFTESVTTRVRS